MTDLVRVQSPRWSWLHWWEANRAPYLTALKQRQDEQDNPAQVDPQLRQNAVEALLRGLEDDNAHVRYASALALGRMREAGAIDGLKKQLESDPHEMVRFAAIVALGLIGDEPSRSFLLQTKYQTDFLRDAAIRALGLADAPSATEEAGLRKLVHEGWPPFADAAVWALSRHHNQDPELYKGVISTSYSPWLVSDAILALGPLNDPQAERLFAALVMQTDLVERIPSWAMLEDIAGSKYQIAELFRNNQNDLLLLRNQYIDEHRRLFDLMPRALRGDEQMPDYQDQPVVVGIEQIYQQYLRTAAAIALEHAPAELAVPALQVLIEERDDDDRYNILPKCFAALSLGRSAAPRSLPVLLAIVDARSERHAKTQEQLESPMRGFAALGLGFYAQPTQTEQGPYDRPGYDKAYQMLVDRLADDREQLEVRAACAVALGLSQRGQALQPLILLCQKLDPANDCLLIGYILLARAMLGDQNVLDPAVKMLSLPAYRDQTMDMLARRSTILAIGVYGGDDAIPWLTKAWHESYYVNREVILALSLCGAPGVSGVVVPILLNSQNAEERAYMAMVIGELFVEHRPEPLNRFLIDSNFPMRDQAQRPYRTLVNEFLYDYLLEDFDQPWY